MKIKFARENFVGQVSGSLLDYYDVVKQLGKGGYGKVYEVKNKKTGEIRACKHLSKLNIKNLEKFRREIEILKKMDHPNIIKLFEVFESDRSIYLIMEECKGGEIFDRIIEHIQNKKMYSEKDAANIIQQVMSCIQYCHNHNICHRDLKPDNMILNELGYLKLIDFGTSIIIKDFTNTITGTPYYIAPEVLLGKGYGFSCDYWSIGIITYEIYYNNYPFGKDANDPMDVYREVIKKNLVIKNGDSRVIQLIHCLLKKKVSERICSLEKAKKLNIFKDFKWDDLMDLKLEPQYIPKVNELKDFSEYNFKYLNFVQKQMQNKTNNNSILSSYDDDDDKDIEYDPNWANNF